MPAGRCGGRAARDGQCHGDRARWARMEERRGRAEAASCIRRARPREGAVVIASGVTCRRIGSVHDKRMWLADDARLLHVASLAADEVIPNQMRGALTRTPVPGDAALVLVDAWALVATLSNRAAWRLDWRGWRPRWIQVAKEDPMHPIVKAHASCDGIWTVDPERRVSVQGRPAIGSSPVPAAEPIATFDIASGIVLLDNGARFGWLGGRWTALPSL